MGLGPSGGERLARRARLLAALATRGRLLGLVAAAAAAAALLALARAAALAAAAGGALRVGDRGRARLAHALLAQALVLLVVLHARSMVLGHAAPPELAAR